jgi:O-antigen/teichoic acid export membrane protein
VASYLGPVLIAFWSPRLDVVVAVVLVLRVLGTLAHAGVCARRCDWRPSLSWPGREASRELFTLGGWMAVSNILSPMLSYLDRLLLGALVPVRMVAVYAAPYDVLNKTMVLPSSIMASLFPKASGLARSTASASQMLHDATRLLFVAMFPLIFVIVAFARPVLDVWLPQIADPGALVMQILALGMLLNSLAQSPATLIQAAGEPRWMAQLHLAELPLFIGVLWLMTVHFGVIGTAVASLLRNGLDAAAVFWIAHRHVAPGPWRWRRSGQAASIAALLLCAACLTTSWTQALLVSTTGLLVFGAYTWHRLLHPDERTRLRGLLRARPGPRPPTV